MAPRHFHHKSKTGCMRCRARRVKCDEGHPVCAQCRRQGAECVYGPRNEAEAKDGLPASTARHDASKYAEQGGLKPDQELSMSESRARRLRELKLVYHYTDMTCKTIDADDPTSEDSLKIWKDAAIRMSFTSDAMLYSILALSAQHLAFVGEEGEANATALEYLCLALPLHRSDVAELSKANADLVCLTGSVLRVSVFASLRQRSIEPYTVPTHFLLQGRGSLDTFATIWKHISEDPNSIARHMVERIPYVRYAQRTYLFGEEHRIPLLHLLHRTPEHMAGEPWSGDIQAAYERTLSYLGQIAPRRTSRDLARGASDHFGLHQTPSSADCRGTNASSPADTRLKRLVLFPQLIPRLFIRLVIEEQPRALVVLAHYFALLADFEHVWWISTVGIREVRGLCSLLNRRHWEAAIVRSLLQRLETVV